MWVGVVQLMRMAGGVVGGTVFGVTSDALSTPKHDSNGEVIWWFGTRSVICDPGGGQYAEWCGALPEAGEVVCISSGGWPYFAWRSTTHRELAEAIGEARAALADLGR